MNIYSFCIIQIEKIHLLEITTPKTPAGLVRILENLIPCMFAELRHKKI